MMDFGLSGFLGKLEEYFGPKITKFMVLLIGLSLSSVCINILYSYAIAPLASSLLTTTSTGTISLYSAIEIVARIGNGASIILLGLYFLEHFQKRYLPSQIEKLMVDAKDILLEIQKSSMEARKLLEGIKLRDSVSDAEKEILDELIMQLEKVSARAGFRSEI